MITEEEFFGIFGNQIAKAQVFYHSFKEYEMCIRDRCSLPVVDTKKALGRCNAGEIVEVTVDNEIAVQNLRKMADHKAVSYTHLDVYKRQR